MKKNISINISGIIFHIEEDGYENLKRYLDSINKYFSTFEDSSEILADIESRIAEIFLSKLNEEKQIITAEDVSSLVATMGSVSDFKAAEAQETETPETNAGPTESQNTGKQESTGKAYQSGQYNQPKQLMRDQKRKILGGVCSGLGNYFNIDALWIRLIFALLFFAYGITLIIYVVMWIAVPGSYDLDEPTGKKMFRDGERKVIGGVAGGVAAYLGIDIVAVRVLFILFTLIGGLGLFLYIVLWLILPEARSLTDKMEMQGEPVTLSNIESTIKKSQTERGAEDESALTRVLLFPFRLIGMILTGLGKILKPLLEVIRVAIGVIIVVVGISLVFSIIVTGGVLVGIFSAASFTLPWINEMNESTVPIEAFMNAFPGWIAVAAFVGTIVPSIFMVLLGVSVIAKKIVFTATAGWTLFVMFFVSVALLSVGIPKIIFSFKEEGEYRVENVYKVTGKRAVLRVNEVGMDDYHATHLTLRGYDGKVFKLVQDFEAQGTTRAKAIENARMVDYNVEVNDSVFVFDSNLRFQPDAVFRGQRLNMNLYIPYNFPFTMDEGMSRFITQYVEYDQMDSQTWKMTEENGLECISCDNGSETDDQSSNELRDFDEVEVSGKFDLKITNGHQYSVELIGPEREKDNYNIYRSGETLVIEYQTRERRHFRFDIKNMRDLHVDEMRINITMPRLEKLEATGFGSIRFEDFTGDEMEIESRGPIKLRGDLNTTNLTINLTGKSEADLSGRANTLTARLELASRLRAYNLDVTDAMIEVSGASSAKVNVQNNLEIEEGVASSVDYRGNPHVVHRD
jgi:phage shock protein PspC (stress-responsive transcriptional regulator)